MLSLTGWLVLVVCLCQDSQKRETDPLYVAENGNKDLSAQGQGKKPLCRLPSEALEGFRLVLNSQKLTGAG